MTDSVVSMQTHLKISSLLLLLLGVTWAEFWIPSTYQNCMNIYREYWVIIPSCSTITSLAPSWSLHPYSGAVFSSSHISTSSSCTLFMIPSPSLSIFFNYLVHYSLPSDPFLYRTNFDCNSDVSELSDCIKPNAAPQFTFVAAASCLPAGQYCKWHPCNIMHEVGLWLHALHDL